MQKSLLVGALCAATFGFACPHFVLAQTVPRVGGRGDTRLALVSGYAALLEAGALLQDGPNGAPTSRDAPTPAENLRRQRLAVARNAPALARLREALQLGIVVPFPQGYDDVGANMSAFGQARELARQLVQEAAVRAADGDARGAAQSDLDSLRMSAQLSRGLLINDLVAIATSSLARKSLAAHAAKLDAAQSREVAAQLDAIGEQMQTPTQMLAAEERFSVQSVAQMFDGLNDPQTREQMQAELNADDANDGGYMNATRAMLQLPFAQVQADYRAQFARAIARAAQPYAAQAGAVPIESAIPYVNLTLLTVTAPSTRFLFERDAVSNRLLADALRLQAIRRESGRYPATFQASADAFAPNLAPLTYKMVGDKYVLYSIGPDGQDDNGAEIQTLRDDPETGLPTITERLVSDSIGDILAPIL